MSSSVWLPADICDTYFIFEVGYDECMELEKEKFLAAVSSFAREMKEKRPSCSWSVVMVPQFQKDRREANEKLKELQEDLKFDVINLTQAHRAMVIRGLYSYSGLHESSPHAEIRECQTPPRG